MRKALIGMLIATTAASPLAAQDQEWRGRGEHHQRSEAQAPQQQRQEARQERQEQRQAWREQRQEQYRTPTERQGGWQGRQAWQGRQQVEIQAAPQVQVRQQAEARSYGGWQSRSSWQGGQRDPRREAYRQQIEASREANRRVSQGMPERYQRRAAENEARYESQVREQYRRENRGSWNRNDWPRNGGDYRGYNRDGRDWRNSWNRTWRNDNRYDWQRWRYSHRDMFRHHYRPPYGYGYGYNRLSIGLILDPVFFGQDYWIGDPWQYRLPPAPYGTQWVRYYNDVLLVDVYTGEVIDVIYDFFW